MITVKVKVLVPPSWLNSSMALRPCKISRVVTLRQIQRLGRQRTLVADIVEMKVALYQLDRQFVPNLGKVSPAATLANNGNAAVHS